MLLIDLWLPVVGRGVGEELDVGVGLVMVLVKELAKVLVIVLD